MASSSASLFHSSPAIRRRYPPMAIYRRHLSLFILSSPVAISSLSFNSPSRAQDIPIFGLRNKIQKVEEEAAEIVKEGEEAVEKEIEAVEEGIEEAEEKLLFGGGLVQAMAVAGVEAVGVLVGVSVVNGILGPEGKKL